ncbi:MAG: cytochrome c biogenesis protein CcsA [Mariprofundaceae bacterium]
MLPDVLFIIAGLASMLGGFLIWREARAGDAARQAPASTISLLVLISLAANLWAMHRIESVTDAGLNFTLAASVALGTLIVQVIYLVGIWHHGVKGLGLFLLPAAGLALLSIPLLPQAHEPNWIRTDSMLETGHLLISLVAWAVLTLAAIHAIMQMLLDRALKLKRVGGVIASLPSLFEIEQHMMAQVRGATVLIGISILTGLSWQWETLGHFAILNHKVLLALFAFGVLALLLFKRARNQWPTRVASRVVLTAYGLLMLAYYGVRLIESWLH